jgi:hypothetical protein
VAPLRLGGLKGKKSTPSVGWEVPVTSQQLARRTWTEHKRGTTTSSSSHRATVRMCIFVLNINKFIVYASL